MNMWLLQVAMCEKCRSIHVLLEEGSKTSVDSGVERGGGGGLKYFRTRDVTNLEEGLLLQVEGVSTLLHAMLRFYHNFIYPSKKSLNNFGYISLS